MKSINPAHAVAMVLASMPFDIPAAFDFEESPNRSRRSKQRTPKWKRAEKSRTAKRIAKASKKRNRV